MSDAPRHCIFYYAFWGTLSCLATLAMVGAVIWIVSWPFREAASTAQAQKNWHDLTNWPPNHK